MTKKGLVNRAITLVTRRNGQTKPPPQAAAAAAAAEEEDSTYEKVKKRPGQTREKDGGRRIKSLGMWGALAADLGMACVAGVVRAIGVVAYGLAAQLLLFAKLLLSATQRLDALLEGLVWRLIMQHSLYMIALLLLYLLCPALLKLLFQLKECVTTMLVEGLRVLLTPCLGDLPPLFYTAIKLSIDLFSGTTLLDLLFQHALASVDS